MERIRTISHKGKTIINIDFTKFNTQTKNELLELIGKAKNYIAQKPPNSALIISDFTGLNFDKEMLAIFMEYSAHNKPYVKASAILGIAGLLNIALRGIEKSTLRDIHSFDTEAQALEWLIAQ